MKMGRLQAVAVFALTFFALFLTEKAVVYGKTTGDNEKNGGKAFAMSGGRGINPGRADASPQAGDNEMERDKDRMDDVMGRIPGRSYVWTVVVGLVLLAAGYAKISDHYYKKHKKNEEEKENRRIAM